MLHVGRIFTRGVYMGHSMAGGWSWLIGIGAALLLAALLYFAITGSKKKAQDNDVLEALKMKFVKGEITEDEYMEKKSVLKGK
jgi:uncharacterized membrane protein